MDVPLLCLTVLRSVSRIAHHYRCKIKSRTLDLERIFRECLFLHLLDIGVNTGRQRQDQCDTDNAYGTCK